MSDDLAQFLLARIAEDEEAAREAASGLIAGHWWEKPGHGRVYSGHWVPVVETTSYVERGEDPEDDVQHPAVGAGALAHIATWDPDRVLVECAAKRQVVSLCQRLERKSLNDNLWNIDEDDEILAALALPYADHEDYDQSWRP